MPRLFRQSGIRRGSRIGFQGDVQFDDSSAARSGNEGESAANVFHAFAHVFETVSGLLLVSGREATAIVFNLEGELIGTELQFEPCGRSVSMFDDVVYCFFSGEEDIMADLG